MSAPVDRSLRAEKVFALVSMHAFADGVVDASENVILKRLAKALLLDPARALEIAATARRACRHTDPDSRHLDARRVFSEVLVLARADGTIDDAEADLVAITASALGISADQSRALAVGALEPGAMDAPFSPMGRAERFFRFVRHPLFSLACICDATSVYRRALAIDWRIWWLKRGATSGRLLNSVVERVQSTVVTIWELERQLVELTKYLAARGLGSPPLRSRSRAPTAVDEMHERRRRLEEALASLLRELTRIEDRVAVYVLAPSAPGLSRLEYELHEALEELEVIVKVVA